MYGSLFDIVGRWSIGLGVRVSVQQAELFEFESSAMQTLFSTCNPSFGQTVTTLIMATVNHCFANKIIKMK